MANHKRVQKSKKINISIEQTAFDKFEQDFLKSKLKNTGLSKGEFLSIVIMRYSDGTDAVKER